MIGGDSPGLRRRVVSNRRVGPHAFVLRFERGDSEFEPGQFLSVGVAGDLNLREYSIYSGTGDPWLEILVREVERGIVSTRLSRLGPGDELRVEGPFGFFTFGEGPLLLVASGTGIAPFHSLARSDPGRDFTLLHGIRYDAERYDWGDYPPGRYLPCVSRPDNGPGRRVTDWLRERPALPDPDGLCCLSGNCDMVYEAYDILRGRGFPSERIKAEVYF